MDVSIFIARKIQKAQFTKGSIIGPVIKAAMLAIVLGMILMIVSVATGMGLKHAIQDKIVGFSGHVHISQYDLNKSFENSPIELQTDMFAEISQMPEVKHIQKVATKAGILKGTEDFEGVVLKGFGSDFDPSFFIKNMREGAMPIIKKNERNDSIVISRALAKTLQISLHDKVPMYFIQDPPRPPRIRKFVVAGIYETGLEEFDKTYLLGDIRHVQKLNGWNETEVGSYEIALHQFEDAEPFTQKLRAFLPYDLDATSVKSKNQQLFQWLDLFDLNIYLILIIMILVAIINMISAILILILDRTNMVGLLKALGATDGKISQIFLYQSVSIIGRGLLWGNLIGLGICLLQMQFGIVSLDPETYYVTEAPIHIDWLSMLYLNIGVLLICLFTLMLPALYVSKISPIKALRYE